MRKQYLVYSLLIMVIFFGCTAASWAFENMPSSARALSVGGAGAALSGGLGEVLALNPALLTTSNAGASLFYNNRFAILGFEEMNISLSWKTAKLHWSSMLVKDGAVLSEDNQGGIQNNQWQDFKVGLGIAMLLKKQISLGLGLWTKVQNITVAEDPEGLFGNEKDFFATMGLYHDSPRFGISAVVEGLFGDTGTQTKFGVRLGEFGKLIGLAEMKYEFIEQRTNYYAGVEAWLASNFAIRAGVDLAGMFTAGLGVGKGAWGIDYTYKIHPAGNTHYLGTGYRF